MKQSQIDLLVMAAQNGNLKAFEALFKHFNSALLRFAYQLSNNETVAHDAVQEAWILSTRSIKRLRDPRAFRSWIYRSVRWKTVDLMRQQRTDTISLDEMVHEPTAKESLEDSVTSSNDLRELIHQLAEIDRQTLHLFYLEEMKISEIAIILEIPEGTVKSRLNRARNQLRKQLEKSEGDHHGH